MSKIIYSIKMVLLGDVINQNLPKGVIPVFVKGQLGKIKQFVKFVLFIYIPRWINVPVVASSPLHDISLFKEMCWYEENVDGLFGKSAWKNHCWYLVDEIMPLSLFSDAVMNEE